LRIGSTIPPVGVTDASTSSYTAPITSTREAKRSRFSSVRLLSDKLLPSSAKEKMAVIYRDFVLGEHQMHAAMLAMVTFFVTILVTALLACCALDAICAYSHHARFARCRSLITRVHDVLSDTVEIQWCPICLDNMEPKDQDGPFELVLMCGHRFHHRCLSRWYAKHSFRGDMCPICRLPHTLSAQNSTTRDEVCQECSSPTRGFQETADEMRVFALQSLYEMFPGIISAKQYYRWQQFSTDLWLQEIRSPTYQSIFRKIGILPMLPDRKQETPMFPLLEFAERSS
jgi:hypothetical protein